MYQAADTAFDKPYHANDKNNIARADDRCCGGPQGRTADNRGKQNVRTRCGVRSLSVRVRIILRGMLCTEHTARKLEKKWS